MGGSSYDAPRRVGTGERLRRTVVLVAGLGVVAGGFVLAPYLALALFAVVAALLRSGSLAASAVGDRRRVRGARWYDGAQVLVGAPWHLTKGAAGTLLLVLWSLGIAAAAALLCFAASLAITASVAVVGAVFGLAMWWGPGGERVRGPVHRVVDPLSRRGVPWLLTVVLVAALGSGLAAAASASGTDWTPDDGAPFSDVRLPGWL